MRQRGLSRGGWKPLHCGGARSGQGGPSILAHAHTFLSSTFPTPSPLQVPIEQPTAAQTISILRGLCMRYEKHHNVRISDKAIVAAATLSDRYIADRYLPDKVGFVIVAVGFRRVEG